MAIISDGLSFCSIGVLVKVASQWVMAFVCGSLLFCVAGLYVEFTRFRGVNE